MVIINLINLLPRQLGTFAQFKYARSRQAKKLMFLVFNIRIYIFRSRMNNLDTFITRVSISIQVSISVFIKDASTLVGSTYNAP